MMDISDTLIAKSDQLNADDLIEPITVKISGVTKFTEGGEKRITIKYEGDEGRPFKPCKTVRRILAKAWGKDATQWTGRSMTIYNDPLVKWAGKPVGGCRVSHLSHIEGTLEISLSETRGMKAAHKILPLTIDAPTQGAPPAQTPPPQDGAPMEINIRLKKSDGSYAQFSNFQEWLDFMTTNLPKIKDIASLNSFETNHEPIFEAYIKEGWGEWVEKARAVIAQNKQRLEPDNGSL